MKVNSKGTAQRWLTVLIVSLLGLRPVAYQELRQSGPTGRQYGGPENQGEAKGGRRRDKSTT